jgi:hypothetical protein
VRLQLRLCALLLSPNAHSPFDYRIICSCAVCVFNCAAGAANLSGALVTDAQGKEFNNMHSNILSLCAHTL